MTDCSFCRQQIPGSGRLGGGDDARAGHCTGSGVPKFNVTFAGGDKRQVPPIAKGGTFHYSEPASRFSNEQQLGKLLSSFVILIHSGSPLNSSAPNTGVLLTAHLLGCTLLKLRDKGWPDSPSKKTSPGLLHGLVNRKSSLGLHSHDLIPAIHIEHLACDRRRAVARQERTRCAEFIRHHIPFQR